MKKIYHYFLFLLFATTGVAAEKLLPDDSSDNRQQPGGDQSVADPKKSLLGSSQIVTKSEEQRVGSEQARENLLRSLDLTTNTPTLADAPIDIFYQERGLVRMAFLNSGYYMKKASGAVASCITFVRACVPLSFMQAASVTAASSYAEMIVRGDSENFPDISLADLLAVFQSDPDRTTFKQYSLNQRTFSFTSQGFNGINTGYQGRAIIKDFAFGQRLVRAGDESKVLDSYTEEKGRTRLNALITLEEHITLLEWLGKRFVFNDLIYLRKLGKPYKDVFGNTCILYELAADPQGLIIEVMRKQDKEYDQLVALWQERWSYQHSQK
ncbi:MAG: hypothetical protein FJX03_01000 [Alphaproteobacteria bacterium]|nr:hypothetical protein [Alphaproteobacteria bacterium]